MIHEKIKTIIASCYTHAQLDTCSQWVDYILDNENKTEADALIQQQRNKVGFTKDDIDNIQKLES